MLHRVRLILNRQRTQLSNAMRAHLAEFGIAAPIGRNGIEQLLDVIADPTDERVPADARFCLEMLLARRKAKVAAVAIANKNARMIWAMMARGERYREPLAA